MLRSPDSPAKRQFLYDWLRERTPWTEEAVERYVAAYSEEGLERNTLSGATNIIAEALGDWHLTQLDSWSGLEPWLRAHLATQAAALEGTDRIQLGHALEALAALYAEALPPVEPGQAVRLSALAD